MNNGIFGEGFPYSNFHDLNMDWIIKIAKDFLDQYTNIQQIIADGETSIQNLTEEGLQQLQDKADALETALQAWYNEHSEDIANQLASALSDLNEWYTEHSADIAGDLASALADLNTAKTTTLTEFNTAADLKAAQTIASIPEDYSAVAAIAQRLNLVNNQSGWMQGTYNDDGELEPDNTQTIVISTAHPIPCDAGTKIVIQKHSTGNIRGAGIYFYNRAGVYIGKTDMPNLTTRYIETNAITNATSFNITLYVPTGVDAKNPSEADITVWATCNKGGVYVFNKRNPINDNLLFKTGDLTNNGYWGAFNTFSAYAGSQTDELGGTDAIKLTIASGTTGSFGTEVSKQQNNIFARERYGTYTFSFWAKSTSDGHQLKIVHPFNGSTSYEDEVHLSTDWAFYRVIFEISKYPADGTDNLYFKLSAINTDVDLYLSHLKLERGAEPTPYCESLPGTYNWVDDPSNREAYNREHVAIYVPESIGKFIDNVVAIQNRSYGEWQGTPNTYGNAAFAFYDNTGVERGAMGYSRNSDSTVNGYFPDLVYVECGHPFGSSGGDSSFAVIVTQNGNTSHFANTSFKPFEHNTPTGKTTIRARGQQGVNIEGKLITDYLILHSANKTWSIEVNDSGQISAREV